MFHQQAPIATEHLMSRFLQSALTVWLSLSLWQSTWGQSPTDPRRRVNVERYGIAVRVPQAWELTSWGQDERAFVLRLPQADDSPVGYVACELGIAPEQLEAFRDRQQANDEREQAREQPRSRLTQNEIQALDEKTFGKERAETIGRRLISVWEHVKKEGEIWYEECTQMISHDTLYTFTLATDEAHYAAYHLDFEEMLASARFSAPQTGLQKLPGGYWMQRDFRFALKLPAGWKPGFGPNEKVLFFASGHSHDAFTDNLLVLATPRRPFDPHELKKTMPEAIQKQDAQAEVAVCDIVEQGDRAALETVVHTRRGPFKITILERRFRGEDRNYEIKFTCDSDEFQRLQGDLRKALDSFLEIPKGVGAKTVL